MNISFSFKSGISLRTNTTPERVVTSIVLHYLLVHILCHWLQCPANVIIVQHINSFPPLHTTQANPEPTQYIFCPKLPPSILSTKTRSTAHPVLALLTPRQNTEALYCLTWSQRQRYESESNKRPKKHLLTHPTYSPLQFWHSKHTWSPEWWIVPGQTNCSADSLVGVRWSCLLPSY